MRCVEREPGQRCAINLEFSSWRLTMRTVCVAVALAVMAAGCKGKAGEQGDTGVSRSSADPVVTNREVQDTAVVRTDTTIKADTTVKKDTMKKSANVKPADTVHKSKTP